MNYEILQGDCLQTLKTLPANSVQCCVTSPPYLNLRSYLPDGHPDKDKEIGGEQSVAEYVGRLVEVFREVRRVLRDDGVLFLNLGDSYNGSGGAGGDYGPGGLKEGQPKYAGSRMAGLKPKDLIGVPWECAFALRADGWYLRSEIIWHKKAPMPESVTDRPTKAHEQLFLLSKSPKYYYDAEAIKEPLTTSTLERDRYGRNSFGGGLETGMLKRDSGKMVSCDPNGRNKRSVWTLGPESYSGSHFATMPTKLVEPCILAGTSAHGACSKCGAPWARVVEVERSNYKASNYAVTAANGAISGGVGKNFPDTKRTTKGWAATCACGCTDVVPCTVLDPFCGSGTTLAVALKHGRHGIGLELNESYIDLAHDRIRKSQPMLILEGA